MNLRSPGEAAGLQPGDVITAVNGQDISLLRHKEGQDTIKRAGNVFVLSINRYIDVHKFKHKCNSPKNRLTLDDAHSLGVIG